MQIRLLLIASVVALSTSCNDRQSHYEKEFRLYEEALHQCSRTLCVSSFVENERCLKSIEFRENIFKKRESNKWTKEDSDRLLLRWHEERSIYIQSFEGSTGRYLYFNPMCVDDVRGVDG